MVQLAKAQRILKFSARNPGTVRVSTENSKAEVILARCAILGPATAIFRIIDQDKSPKFLLSGSSAVFKRRNSSRSDCQVSSWICAFSASCRKQFG